VLVFSEETTEQGRVQEELRRSEERLRLAVTGARVGTWHWDLRTDEVLWSDVNYAIFGLPPGSRVSYERFKNLLHPDDRARVEAAVRHALETRTEYDIEHRIVWPDGSVHWMNAKGLAFFDALGRPLRMEGISLDITPRKEVERALLEGEERYRKLAEGMPHMLWQLDATGTLVYANRGWREYFGRDAIALFQWGDVVHPDDLSRVLGAWPDMSRGETNIEPFRLRRHDGMYRWFTCRSVPVRDAAGELLHVIGISTDVEELVRAEEALLMSQVRLDTALRAAGMGTWVWDVDTDDMRLDQALAQLLGVDAPPTQPVSRDQMLTLVHADDFPAVRAALQRVFEQNGDLEVECRVRGHDGRTVWLATKGRMIPASEGQRRHMLGACVDITQHKRLEEDLRQAQKMEAIGQLAGGVAHDFNNLLTVILGQVALAELGSDLPQHAREAIAGINDAAERAAALTAQLLAFGRRQPMHARDLSLDELMLSVTGLLTRVLGEHIALVFEPASAPRSVHADPNMLTQVLLNLAINARDAMPTGGSLIIQTSVRHAAEADVSAADGGTEREYVCLSVRDSGQGIAPADLPHIFEPFYTTKELGKGTGLGLATVYGIVKQHQGFVTVDSQWGRGSTFEVYLPVAFERRSEELVAPIAPVQGRGELILLVEDEDGVRRVMQTILEQHGYRLLVAANGDEALCCWSRRAEEVALLVTDVVMPRGLDGCELAAMLQAQRAELKVILCSGYSAANVTEAMRGIKRSAFLQKPYRPDQLLELVRRKLDSE